MKIKYALIWMFLDILFAILLVGLYFEIINNNYSWWYFWIGIVCACLVNLTIILDCMEIIK
jgi:uncharacterized membrane-anchored protein